MNGRTVLLVLAGGLYVVMWFGGVAAYLFRGGPGPHEAWTAPAFLALAALLVLLTSSRRTAAWLTLVLLAGFASEYAGVQCDCIFGPYSYTDALAPRLLGVPLVMSAAWMILIAYVKDLLAARRLPAWGDVVFGGAWMTAIDLVIDPVAAGPLRYWQWESAGSYYGIPAWNFAGWFVVSAAMFLALRAAGDWPANPWARRIGLSIVLFFTAIAMSHGLWLCAGAGAALVGIHLAIAARRSSE